MRGCVGCNELGCFSHGTKCQPQTGRCIDKGTKVPLEVPILFYA